MAMGGRYATAVAAGSWIAAGGVVSRVAYWPQQEVCPPHVATLPQEGVTEVVMASLLSSRVGRLA